MNNKALIKEITDVIAAIDRLYEEWARRYGFTLLEKQFFQILSEHENGTLTQKNLCEMMNCSKTTINTIVKKMIKLEYVYIEYSEDSRKEKVIILTERGMEIINIMITALVDKEAAAIGSLPFEEIQNVIKGLSDYKGSLEQQINEGMDEN